MSTDLTITGWTPIQDLDTAYDPEAVIAAADTIDRGLTEYDWERDGTDGYVPDRLEDDILTDYTPQAPGSVQYPVEVNLGDELRECTLGIVVEYDDEDVQDPTPHTTLLTHDVDEGHRWALGETDEPWVVETSPIHLRYRHPVSGTATFSIAPWDETPITGSAIIGGWQGESREELASKLEDADWGDTFKRRHMTRDLPAAADQETLSAYRIDLVNHLDTDAVTAGSGATEIRYDPDPGHPEDVREDITAFANAFEQLLLAACQIEQD